MWIDTHCHLDAAEYGDDAADGIAANAEGAGISQIVIPAVERANFASVRTLAARHANCVYALGIHPMYVQRAEERDLAILRAEAEQAMSDSRFVAIGEIGLDFFVPELNEEPLRTKQEYFYSEQLKLARDLGLPVLLHVRRSQDVVLKHLRRVRSAGGIAHAFNGSFQQAEEFMRLGFRLGFGGAMTFPRARQIRRLAAELPQDAIVLETDAPDIPPEWLKGGRNSPEQLPRIGRVLADLRNLAPDQVAEFTSRNARAALPRLAS